MPVYYLKSLEESAERDSFDPNYSPVHKCWPYGFGNQGNHQNSLLVHGLLGWGLLGHGLLRHGLLGRGLLTWPA